MALTAMMPRRVTLAALGAMLAAPALGQPATRDREFQAFWRDFRAAALAHDGTAIVRLSRLPVESRGELDDEPVLRLTAATLPPAFRRLLATVEDPASGRTVRDMIRNTAEPRLDGRNASPGQVRLDSLQFARTREGWRLTTIYRGPEEKRRTLLKSVGLGIDRVWIGSECCPFRRPKVGCSVETF